MIPLHDPMQLPKGRPVFVAGPPGVDAEIAGIIANLPGVTKTILVRAEPGSVGPDMAAITPSSLFASPPGAGVLVIAEPSETATALAALFPPDAVYDARVWLARSQRIDQARRLLDALTDRYPIDGGRRLVTWADFEALPADRAVHIYGTGKASGIVRAAVTDVARLPVAAFIETERDRDGRLDGFPVIGLDVFCRTATGAETVVIASQHWRAIDRSLIQRGFMGAYNAFPFVLARIAEETANQAPTPSTGQGAPRK